MRLNPRPNAELVGAAARRVFLLCCSCGATSSQLTIHSNAIHRIASHRTAPPPDVSNNAQDLSKGISNACLCQEHRFESRLRHLLRKRFLSTPRRRPKRPMIAPKTPKYETFTRPPKNAPTPRQDRLRPHQNCPSTCMCVNACMFVQACVGVPARHARGEGQVHELMCCFANCV